jgi:hypothetical protein
LIKPAIRITTVKMPRISAGDSLTFDQSMFATLPPGAGEIEHGFVLLQSGKPGYRPPS